MTSYKMGPGTLTLGAGPLAATGQVTNCRVEWSESVSGGEVIPLLDDTDLVDEETASYKASLAGNLVQDIAAAGVVAWSWTNKGTEQAFTFVPSTAEGRKVTGTLVPVPLTVGGDVKKRNRADFTWRIVGDPVLDDVA